MKYLSLFSGIGGFELGINNAYENTKIRLIQQEASEPRDSRDIESRGDYTKPDCIGFSEIDKYATEVYQKHFPKHKALGDITKFEWDKLDDFDLLVGGFPCQAFSIAGKRKGFEDTRGTLFFDIAKGLKIKQPSFVVLENVKGLMSHDKGKTLETILESLQELGYYVNIEVYNSKDFGVPQNRERIIFICKHIKTIIKDGENLNLNTSRVIIEQYLFQILLNNLVEVKKLQEVKSKDWVLAWLLWKEINQTLNLTDQKENIKGGTWTPTEEDKLKSVESLWQSIDILLNKNLVENSKDQSKFTTLTEIKQIIESKIYTFSQMQRVILLLTGHLRNSHENSWKEMLSNLIVIKENTKYARINYKKEEIVITETGNAYLTKDIQKNGQHFIIGHLRGTSRPEVFPFGEANNEIERNTTINQINNPKHSNDRVYSDDGLSPTLNTMQGGNRQPFIVGGLQGHQTPRKDNVSPCLTSAMGTGGGQTPVLWSEDIKIRRLTPLECERLQGFPDGWTDVCDTSDSQRYKMCGNAVTVNVIKDIMEKLLVDN